ncbi:sigma-54-dependent Fis family transcriptional regulator [Pseudacidovorax intermedius]|uniref:Fis family transcriptional regulator n=1 Tax=Pseudacidovorax intermedius TaxID=433924 RepID=A0A147H821_9BURK|nr:sigma-54-dependent Fis family transcriptional regulator [Pseudacidovorax intermedius]KTT25901.1 Fis family transcriptional regulator [Pseudacidovorax intermedius]
MPNAMYRPTPAAGAALPLAAPDAILASHARSAEFGLRSHERADLPPLAPAELAEAMARNALLFDHARPVMETLYAQIAGTQSLVLLTGADGVILHALGDDDFLGRADRVALKPGAAWSERSRGTNAIGTALALQQAVQVHGSQHYLQANHFLTCACAPILDPRGQVLGALDVSGDERRRSAHTLALVRMSSQMVENHLFDQLYQDALRLRFHARPEFLGTLMEGLAAFTPDGRFLAANRSAQFQLGLSTAALAAHTFGSLFGVAVSQVLAHARQSPGTLLRLHLPGGAAVSARAESQARPAMLTVPAEAPSATATATAASARARQSGGPRFSGLRYLDTGDAQLAQVLARVGKVVGQDVPVLILGETGTGKEWLARAIHHDSPRRDGAFVAVNCAAIPEALIESELFGYEEGAFTGARRKGHAGRILQASGGTLFLDEIGDMPLAMQARLLRVLQERSVAPLGSGRQVPVDLAVVCATHRNLRAMMAEGRFRDDLYWRLNGLVARLPPLRERSDLAVVVQRLLQTQQSEAGLADAPPLAPQTLALLRRHAWPGNLRQLASVLRTAALMARGEAQILPEHLPEELLDDLQADAADGAPGAVAPPPSATTTLDALEQAALAQAMATHGGNVSAVARALGLSRNAVYRRLRRR